MAHELCASHEAFYKETDIEKRRKLLQEILENGEDDGANALRKALFDSRYPDTMPGKDAFALRCSYERSLYDQRDAMFTSIGRDTRKTMRMFHLEHPKDLSEAELNALYWEFRHTAACMIRNYENNASYGSRFFGLKKATPEDRRRKLCEDIWAMSRGAALYANEGKRLTVYCDAFRDELLDYDPSLTGQYRRLDEDLLRTLP